MNDDPPPFNEALVVRFLCPNILLNTCMWVRQNVRRSFVHMDIPDPVHVCKWLVTTDKFQKLKTILPWVHTSLKVSLPVLHGLTFVTFGHLAIHKPRIPNWIPVSRAFVASHNTNGIRPFLLLVWHMAISIIPVPTRRAS